MDLKNLSPEEYLALARDIYEKRARGDTEPGLLYFHDDVIYRLLGSRALIPAAGVRVGKDEVREAWRAFDVDFEILSFEIDDLVVDFPRMSYMSWHMTLRNRGTGATVELEGVDRLKWRDFKVAEWTRYFDTALVAALRDGEDSGPAE
jgi:ketosteroid isomerase-like protein